MAGKEGVGRREDGTPRVLRRQPRAVRRVRRADADRRRQRLPGARRARPGARRLPRRLRARRLARRWSGAGGSRAGETVLVLGASGVVGQIGVQAAQLLGAGRVVAAARDEAALAARRRARRGRARPARRRTTSRRAARRPRAATATTSCSTRSGASRRVAAIAARSSRSGGSCNMGQSAGAEATLTSAAVRNTPIDLLGHTNYTAREERKARGVRAAWPGMRRRASCASRSSGSALDDVPDGVASARATSPHAKLVMVAVGDGLGSARLGSAQAGTSAAGSSVYVNCAGDLREARSRRPREDRARALDSPTTATRRAPVGERASAYARDE